MTDPDDMAEFFDQWPETAPDRRPASMLEPFTFSGDEEDAARRVVMRPVDETEDEW